MAAHRVMLLLQEVDDVGDEVGEWVVDDDVSVEVADLVAGWWWWEIAVDVGRDGAEIADIAEGEVAARDEAGATGAIDGTEMIAVIPAEIVAVVGPELVGRAVLRRASPLRGTIAGTSGWTAVAGVGTGWLWPSPWAGTGGLGLSWAGPGGLRPICAGVGAASLRAVISAGGAGAIVATGGSGAAWPVVAGATGLAWILRAGLRGLEAKGWRGNQEGGEEGAEELAEGPIEHGLSLGRGHFRFVDRLRRTGGSGK